jgi:anti-sigma factor RsiW
MACADHVNAIQELVDGTLGQIRRAELDAHLEICEDCRALLRDLERIRDAGADLPEMEPPARVWLQVAGRLRQEGRIREEARPAAKRFDYRWLAAAAALVIALGASVVVLAPHLQRVPPMKQAPAATGAPAAPAGNAAPAQTVESVQNEVDQAQQQFEKAIADLEKVARANQQALDPTTAATIDKNLGIIDQAIAENRAAVKAEPTSVAARATLFEALRQKVSLLQDTIALINEMRKGNNAAAAELVNKS